MRRLKNLMVIVSAMGIVLLMSGNAISETKNPFEKAIEDRFMSMDANKDGKIDYDEYSAAYQKSIKSSFDRRDQNKDGALTKDEFMPKIGKPGTKGASNPFQQMIQKKKAEQQQDSAVQQKEKTSGEAKAGQEEK